MKQSCHFGCQCVSICPKVNFRAFHSGRNVVTSSDIVAGSPYEILRNFPCSFAQLGNCPLICQRTHLTQLLMKNFQDKVVWITGASSGIGEALAYQFAQKGATLILSARRVTELERVKATCGEDKADRIHIVPLDLTQTEGVEALANEWVKKLGHIDVLINNGGISQRSLAVETPMSVDRRIMEVNYFGQVALTKAVLPHMIKQQSGHIAAISSLTGKFGFPLRSAYAASKHALHGYFETVLLENHANGIGVTVVNPGRIKTAISINALGKDGEATGVMDPGQAKGLPADVCAARIIRAIQRNRPDVTIGKADVLMVYFKRYIPGLFRAIAKRIDPR